MDLDELIKKGKKFLFGEEEKSEKPQSSDSSLDDLIASFRAKSNVVGETATEQKTEKPKKSTAKKKNPLDEFDELLTDIPVSTAKSGVCVCLDLGNDTLKIAFAYQNGDKVGYGKILKDGLINQVAFPATAYYDEKSGEWIYADEIERGEEKSFTTVVKIKNLLSLLSANSTDSFCASNETYYYSGNNFPKFYFPTRRGMEKDFGQMVSGDMTFLAPNHTPKSVCKGFFAYARKIVDSKLAEIVKSKKIKTDDEIISSVAIVHPPTYNQRQIEELTALVSDAFNKNPQKVMTTTRALCLYAYTRGALGVGESALAFDMGDETLSVVKGMVKVSGGKVSVIADGQEGHSLPLNLGGNDIDEAVGKFLENSVYHRETMGSAYDGEDGHIYEHGLDSKQYLFMKEIKKAKMILSKPLAENSRFIGGVPISMYRDLHIQRKLTAQQFSECIGLNGGGKIADKIANYIIAELDKPVNTGVIKVFLAGGLVETYGLVDYIREKVSEKHKKVKIFTFDDKIKSTSADTILSYEDGIYASAVGGAIVALNDYDIKMGLSFSYGTWGNVSTGNGTQKSKCLLNFVYRGTEVEYDNQEFWSPFSFDIGNTDCINNEEIFASTVTAESLENREKPNRAKINYYAFGGSYVLEVGNINSTERKNAQKAFALTTVAGGSKSKIFIFHNGKRVRVNDTVKLCEGVKIDRDGHATPIIKNAYLETDKTKVSITYLTTGTTKKVYAREITFGFVDVKGFSATIN